MDNNKELHVGGSSEVAAMKGNLTAKEVELQGSHRSAIVGSKSGSRFEITFPESESKKRSGPPRFQEKSVRRTITAEQIQEKQKLAEERKKKIDANKARQAKKVSQEAIKFDKMAQARMAYVELQAENQRRWYKGALKHFQTDT